MVMQAGAYLIADDQARCIARGSRSTNTGTTTTTETSALRIDDVPVFAGRSYLIVCSGFIGDSSVNGDDINVRLRYTTDGTDATTTSTILGGVLTKTTAVSGQVVHCIARNYVPSADETLSILMTFVRAAGTGNVNLTYATGYPIEITVYHMGAAPADTGVSL